jgi:tetratricopeptide (TPR) repeat protein
LNFLNLPMKIFHFFPLCLFILASCTQQENAVTKHEVPEAAKKLNDSAIVLYQRSSKDSAELVKMIELLDKATAIDSNFYMAYNNKIMFLFAAKQYDKALVASKQLIRIHPEVPDFYGRTGIICEILGDSVTAHGYFVKAGELYDHILDTMNTASPDYDMFVMTVGMNKVMMGEEQKGNEILKQVYDRQKDPVRREAVAKFVGKNKKEMIEMVKTGK